MSSELDITVDELLEYIRQAESANGETLGATKQELVDALGWTEYKVDKWIRKLHKDGKIKGTQAYRTNIAGISAPRIVYVLTGKE